MLRQSEIEDSMYVHMFLDDINLHIIPLRLSDSNERGIEIISNDEVVSQRAIHLLSEPNRFDINVQNTRPRHASTVLSEFIKAVSNDIALHGRSYWEIGNIDISEPYQLSTPRLFWIAGDVTSRRRTVRQQIVRHEGGTHKRFDTVLPDREVQIFRLPRCLGTAREQRERVQVMFEASKIVPPFVEQSLSRLEEDPDFRYNDYSRAKFEALAKAMKEWGWIGRFWESKFTTEYYYFLCKVKFHRILAELRESILREINSLLKRLEIDCEIHLRGLKTAAEISEVLEQLKSGSISFGEAIDLARS